jgi:hypothetical protein
MRLVVTRDHVGVDQVVHLEGCVAFQAAYDLAFYLSSSDASLQVEASALVLSHAGDHDAVQSGVGLPVSAAVEPTALALPRGLLNRADTAQGGEGCLAGQLFLGMRVRFSHGPQQDAQSGCLYPSIQHATTATAG